MDHVSSKRWPALESKLYALPSDLSDSPQTTPFNLIFSYPLEPDYQPFSGLLAFARAVLTAWSPFFALLYWCQLYPWNLWRTGGRVSFSMESQGFKNPSVKEVAIKLDARPLTHALDKSCCPPDPQLWHSITWVHMSAVLHCYLNVVPFKNF